MRREKLCRVVWIVIDATLKYEASALKLHGLSRRSGPVLLVVMSLVRASG